MKLRALQTTLAILGMMLVLAGFQIMAQPGTLIQNTPLPVDGRGVSVAVDCQGNIYYTIRDPDTSAGFPNLYVMDKDGFLLNTLPTVDQSTGAALLIDEMSWDEGRQLLWGVEHNTNPVDVYLIDPATGIATFQFTSQTASIGTYRDGIAYDPSDDTLWMSGDLSTTIEHYKTDGTFLNAITPKDAAAADLGNISGVMVGVGDLLYVGQAALVNIVQVKKSDGSFISNFASPGGARDEGLECDPINFAPTLALWSRDVGLPQLAGFVSAIEIEPDTCQCCSLEAFCVETVNPHGRNIPKAPAKGGQGQNQDGYYELGTNGCGGPEIQVYVRDTESGMVWGPFDQGTRIKYTEANGKPPGIKPHAGNNGNGGSADAVQWHIWGQGDLEVFAIDLGGNPTDPVSCLVPPPPK